MNTLVVSVITVRHYNNGTMSNKTKYDDWKN